MDDRQKMRASDHDRQEVVDRLGDALEDGRLKMDEYIDRTALAYQAVTHGDLAPLYADLPAAGSKTGREAAPPAWAPPARSPPARCPGRLAGGAQGAVDDLADRRVGQRGRLGSGQRHRCPPGLSLAALGRRSVRGRAVRGFGWHNADPAQSSVRPAVPAAGEGLIQACMHAGNPASRAGREGRAGPVQPARSRQRRGGCCGGGGACAKAARWRARVLGTRQDAKGDGHEPLRAVSVGPVGADLVPDRQHRASPGQPGRQAAIAVSGRACPVLAP